MNFEIINKDCISSTNDFVKSNINIFNDRTVVTAKEQTKGKGRMNRAFFSYDGGLYFSILLKKPDALPDKLTAVAAVAVMKGIYKTFSIKTHVKWVNDIMYQGKKVCGILCEGSFNGNKLDYGIIGVGINLSDTDFPDDIKDIAGTLHRSSSDKDILLQNILNTFFAEIESSEYLDYYKKNCITLNKNIEIIKPGCRPVPAFAVDITPHNNLIVEYSDGKTDTVFCGEVSIK